MWPFTQKRKPSSAHDPILALANRESARFGHNYIGTEHVLSALLELKEPRIDALFSRCVVSGDTMRDAVRTIVSVGPHIDVTKHRLVSPRLKQVLTIAESERERIAHLTVAESILLALISEGSGVAIRALKSLDLDLARIQEELSSVK